jgi:hypothetical protein
MDMVAHIQGLGAVGGTLGEWLGSKDSKRWIEGFAVSPVSGVPPGDIEYQAVLGRDWLSPWVEAGQFCGSRGMALPVLGLRLRLRGASADAFDCSYAATFVDGSEVGPVTAGAPCEAASLAPLESLRIDIRPRGEGLGGEGVAAEKAATRKPSGRPTPRRGG